MENTTDLSKFGYRELAIAGELLKQYADYPDALQGDNVRIEFNPSSGNVFLVDNNHDVAMLDDDDKLGRWYDCPNCGHEGFIEEFKEELDENKNVMLVCTDCTGDHENRIVGYL
jgi:hypothetical protein